MNEKELQLFNELEQQVNEAMVRLCAVQVSGPAVVVVGRCMEALGAAVDKCRALRKEMEEEP